MKRRGFTVLEVVVVMGVIGIALALLLPAVFVARESARRIQCQNNLRQISLALHNYHDMHSVFPPGYVARGVDATDPAAAETGPGFAWSVLLFPFIDQAPLYRTLDFSVDPYISFAPGGTILAAYVCESSPDARMSYAGSFGFGSLTTRPGRPAVPGVFYRNSRVPEFDIRDGTSNTFLVGERADVHNFVDGEPPVQAGGLWMAAARGVYRDAGVTSAPDSVEGPASFLLANVGQDEPFQVHAVHCRTNHIAAFSSRHPGGANFAMADGAVMFVADTIEYELYRRLGQRSDRQVAEVPRDF